MSAPAGGHALPVYELDRDDGADVPFVLLRYQAEAVRLSHEHQLFVEEKSRRTGLTYGFAADSVMDLGTSTTEGS